MSRDGKRGWMSKICQVTINILSWSIIIPHSSFDYLHTGTGNRLWNQPFVQILDIHYLDLHLGSSHMEYCRASLIDHYLHIILWILTPCRSKAPENYITKIGCIDYVAGGNMSAKFYGNRPRGVFPTNSWSITSCDFAYLPFPFLFSCRCLQQKRLYVSHRLIRQTTRFQPRMCLLGVRKFKFNI